MRFRGLLACRRLINAASTQDTFYGYGIREMKRQNAISVHKGV